MQPSNYRPISNLSTISKILERVVLKRLSSHVSVLRNFNLFQSAYRSHHSTETALLYITDSLRNICATGSAAVLFSLDISAAFDTINHPNMLHILENYFHISGIALSWFQSYLSERKQFVKISCSSSTLVSVRFGVPQGSVLGPILFSLLLLARSYRSTTFYIISLLMILLYLQAPLTLILIPASLRYLNASLSSIFGFLTITSC